MPDGLIDIVICTLNEEQNIAKAIAAAEGLGHVYIVDSGSSDATQSVARELGATVIEHVFESYSRQKNWALANLPLQGEWVLILDADERVTPALARQIRKAIHRKDVAGYYLNRQLIFAGRVIRHGGLYPSWNMRLIRRGRAWYEDRSVHEHMVCDGPTAYLNEPMLHVRMETVSQYIAKHIRYADMESDEWVKRRLGTSGEAATGRLFQNRLRWRQWLRRHAWRHAPCRPLVRWVYMFIFKLGFLDGRAGWRLAWLMANYEYMISTLYQDKLLAARGRKA